MGIRAVAARLVPAVKNTRQPRLTEQEVRSQLYGTRSVETVGPRPRASGPNVR